MEGRGRALTIKEVACSKLAELETDALRRVLSETERANAGRTSRNGRHLVSFCCNDYLGLSQHPVVKRAASEAIEKYGAGAGASARGAASAGAAAAGAGAAAAACSVSSVRAFFAAGSSVLSATASVVSIALIIQRW